MDTESWRPIPSTAGRYEASSLARVRNAATGHVLKPRANDHGYLAVKLSVNRRTLNRTVHSLVAEAFIGPRPRGKIVNHKDADPGNCLPGNLEYITQRQNMLHAKGDPDYLSRGESVRPRTSLAELARIGRHCRLPPKVWYRKSRRQWYVELPDGKGGSRQIQLGPDYDAAILKVRDLCPHLADKIGERNDRLRGGPWQPFPWIA